MYSSNRRDNQAAFDQFASATKDRIQRQSGPNSGPFGNTKSTPLSAAEERKQYQQEAEDEEFAKVWPSSAKKPAPRKIIRSGFRTRERRTPLSESKFGRSGLSVNTNVARALEMNSKGTALGDDIDDDDDGRAFSRQVAAIPDEDMDIDPADEAGERMSLELPSNLSSAKNAWTKQLLPLVSRFGEIVRETQSPVKGTASKRGLSRSNELSEFVAEKPSPHLSATQKNRRVGSVPSSPAEKPKSMHVVSDSESESDYNEETSNDEEEEEQEEKEDEEEEEEEKEDEEEDEEEEEEEENGQMEQPDTRNSETKATDIIQAALRRREEQSNVFDPLPDQRSPGHQGLESDELYSDIADQFAKESFELSIPRAFNMFPSYHPDENADNLANAAALQDMLDAIANPVVAPIELPLDEGRRELVAKCKEQLEAGLASVRSMYSNSQPAIKKRALEGETYAHNYVDTTDPVNGWAFKNEHTLHYDYHSMFRMVHRRGLNTANAAFFVTSTMVLIFAYLKAGCGATALAIYGRQFTTIQGYCPFALQYEPSYNFFPHFFKFLFGENNAMTLRLQTAYGSSVFFGPTVLPADAVALPVITARRGRIRPPL